MRWVVVAMILLSGAAAAQLGTHDNPPPRPTDPLEAKRCRFAVYDVLHRMGAKIIKATAERRGGGMYEVVADVEQAGETGTYTALCEPPLLGLAKVTRLQLEK